MKMKKIVALGLTAVMTLGLLVGCGGSSDSSETDTSEATSSDTNSTEVEEVTLTLLIDTDVTLAGFEAVCALAEEELGITIDIETRPGGNDGDNIVKTRLAAGDMADLCLYNSGALLAALNPSEYFIDISGESWAGNLDDTYASSVTVAGATYGIPYSSTQAGAVVYSKTLYDEYNLEVPTTWDEFMDNCKVLQDAGETAILGTSGDSWTSQVAFLGDNYSIMYNDPDFATGLEAGTTKWATSDEGVRSFEKLADTAMYYNDDFLATTYDDGCDIMANGEAGHWIILTQALSNIYELYGDQVNDLGVFAVPGDTEEENGLTAWMPSSIYGNKNSENQDAILKFMEFYISYEALDAYTSVILPDGPYCVEGYELPDNAYTAVSEDMQAYFDAGKTNVALEFLTPVKGADCMTICQELVSGQTTPEQAAAKYDEDCAKMATQLGLDW
ncbi:MAG: ABC transporter substrate-binding protein [Suipraeoptans sp.]